ncbi:MAG: metal-sulfur cluster assembly factor [Pseudomonadota bacterium]|jgi:metal-sulfur cluster biosynthetic enzyme
MPDEEQLLAALREVNDPEVGLNIVDLGLVYGVETLREEGEAERLRARVRMTMTSPACPLGDYLTDAVREALRARFPEIAEVEVEMVWDPPWTPERMSEQARGFFGWHA